jgi:hypothetical protein
LCTSTLGQSADGLASTLRQSANDLSLALILQRKLILFTFAFAGSTFLIGIILLTLLKTLLKSTQSGKAGLRLATLGFLYFSVACAITATISLIQITNAMKFLLQSGLCSSVEMIPGQALKIIQGFVCEFSAAFVVGVQCLPSTATQAGPANSAKASGGGAADW